MTERRSNKYWQQQEEKNVIDPLLDKLNIPKNDRHYSDRPDVWISLDGKKIGIEITQIKLRKNLETQAALYKLFEEYNKHLATITKDTYQIEVMFLDVDYPKDIKLLKHKELIFKEIDGFIPGHTPNPKRKFIEYASFYPSPNCDTFTSEVVVLESEILKIEDLLECIAKKENKLNNYKSEHHYDEYWLVVNFPFIEQTDFRRFEAPRIDSAYNRIYLVEIGAYKQVK